MAQYTQVIMDGKRILIVEDDQALRNLYREILVQEGYNVTDVSDGEQGLFEMQKGGYDLVLLDLILPKMDGLQILKALQGSPPQNANKSVVILTNLGQEQTVADAVSLGAKSYMIKSDFTPDQVVSEVKHFLDGN